MKRYKVSKYYPEIQEVEVERETDKTVWIRKKTPKKNYLVQERKSSEGVNYFTTWSEAHDWLLESFTLRIDQLTTTLNSTKERMQLVLMMEPPMDNNENLPEEN